jgi:hypothetical protein
VKRRDIFVTNSSSSHNMVMRAKGTPTSGANWGLGEFGWELFVLTTKKEKEVYMAVTAYENLTYYKRFPLKEEEAVKEVNRQFEKEIITTGEWVHIDHQSLIALPQRASGHKTIDWEFFWELTSYIVDNDNLVIIGGNDNDTSQDKVNYWSWGKQDKIYALLPVDIDIKTCFSTPLGGPEKWEIVWKGWSGTKERRIVQTLQFPPSEERRKHPILAYRRPKTHLNDRR